MSSLTFTPAKQIVIERKHIDSWFISRAHLNIYRGCRHDCAYCDGRYEGYHVPDEFGADIVARENAPQLLDAALNPHRKRRWRSSGYLMLGGGVSDSYQPDEKKVALAQACLKVVLNRRQPVHILTKSTLVERDLSLIRQIHDSRGAIVSMSFSGVNDELARVFEPGCPTPSKRLDTMARFAAAGVPTGMFLMPVIPGITDSAVAIGESIRRAVEIGASFVVFGGMTLKSGRQKDYFDAAMTGHFPAILEQYPKIYRGDRWGSAVPAYYQRIEHRFTEAARIHRMWRRIPPRLFTNVCDADDRIQVILGQLDYLQRAVGDRLPFGALARSLRKGANAPTLIEPPAYPSEQMAILREIQENGGEKWYMRYL